MIQIFKELYIGNAQDYEGNIKRQNGWAVIHACKEPYHRQALGYTGRAIANTHPEYLFAYRGNRLILNLVDVDNPNWISPIIIDEAINFIDKNLNDGLKVLVHCNQGESRSAGIGLIYLSNKGYYTGKNFLLAENEYRKLYPLYNPAAGMREFIRLNWNKYCI